MKRSLLLVAVSAFVAGCSTVTTYPQTSVTAPSAAASSAGPEKSAGLLVDASLCAGLVPTAVFRADQQTGPEGALEVIDTGTGARKRFAAEWPGDYHLAQVSGALALVGDDGSVVAHDGDRFPGLEVCDMEQGVIRVVGLGPLPGISPEVGPSQAH